VNDEIESKQLDEQAFTSFCEENLIVKPSLSNLDCRRLGKQNNTKPRRLLVHLTSEQNAHDVLVSAKTLLLRKSSDRYIASSVYFNADMTYTEAKLAFEERQKRRAAKIAQPTVSDTIGADSNNSGVTQDTGQPPEETIVPPSQPFQDMQ